MSAQLKEFKPAIVKNFPLPRYASIFWSNPTMGSFHQALTSVSVEQRFYGLESVAHRNKNKEWIMSFREIELNKKLPVCRTILSRLLSFG